MPIKKQIYMLKYNIFVKIKEKTYQKMICYALNKQFRLYKNKRGKARDSGLATHYGGPLKS